VVPVGILPDGTWVIPADLDTALHEGLGAVATEPIALALGASERGFLKENGEVVAVDFAFPVLHGTFGEDGTIQGLLEMASLPYAGAGVVASAVGMDKEMMKAAFASASLPQVDYMVVRDSAADVSAALVAIERRFSYPVFIKPANLGSSVGMTKAHDRPELAAALALAFQYDRKVVVEAFCAGRELECAVLGNETPQASLPGEVVPRNEFYDFEAKYTDGMMEFRVPAPLDAATTERVRSLAVQAFRAIDCSGYARCDFFLDSGGGVLVNEINTIPGMTSMSAFPRLWEATGVNGTELVDRIVSLGLARATARAALSTSR